jgi:hypothetical protein
MGPSRGQLGIVTVKLDYHIVKSVVNAFFGLFVGRGARPTFFKVTEAYPWLDHLTRAVRREFDRLLAESNDLPQYHDVDPGERAISATTPKRWNVFLLEIMGHRPADRFITDVVARHTYGRSVARKAEAFASVRGAKRLVTA